MSAVLDQSGDAPPPAGGRRLLSALTLTASICSAVVLTGVMIVLVVAPRDSAFLYDPLLGFVCTLVCLAMGWWFVRWCGKWNGPSLPVSILLALALTVVSCVVTYYSEFDARWDPTDVRSGAHQVVTNGHLGPRYMIYFGHYPNNLPLLFVTTLLVRFARATGLSYFDTVVIANGVLFFGTCVLTSVCLSALGRRRLIIPVLLLLTVLLGFYPYMTVFYSDLPGAFACSLLLVIGIKIWKGSPHPYLLMCLMAGVSAAVYPIKPYILVIPLAGLVMWLLSGGLKAYARGWGVLGAGVRLLLILVLAFLVSHIERSLAYQGTHTTAAELEEYKTPLPVLHWAAMGLHDGGGTQPERTYGAFDAKVFDRDDAVSDPDELNRVILDGIAADFRRQGVGGTAMFIGKKLSWVLGDGNFFGQKEGHDEQARPVRPGPIADVTLMSGRWYGVKTKLTQSLWGAVLIALIVGLVCRRRHTGLACLSLAFMGFVFYEAIFEARPRYVIAILPMILIMLALVQSNDGQESVSWVRMKRPRSADVILAACDRKDGKL